LAPPLLTPPDEPILLFVDLESEDTNDEDERLWREAFAD
jgi:hypothetical protein